MTDGIPTLLGVPCDAASSHQRGAALGPTGIRAGLAADSSNGWSEDGVDVGDPNVVADAGDLAFPDPDDGPAVRTAIEAGVTDLRPVVLGGDHSITYPVLRALSRRYPGPRSGLVAAKLVKELVSAMRANALS